MSKRPGEISTAEWRRRAELQFSPFLPVALWCELVRELIALSRPDRDVPQTVEVTDEMLGINKDWNRLYEALEDIVAHAESGEWTLPSSFAARARAALSRPLREEN